MLLFFDFLNAWLDTTNNDHNTFTPLPQTNKFEGLCRIDGLQYYSIIYMSYLLSLYFLALFHATHPCARWSHTAAYCTWEIMMWGAKNQVTNLTERKGIFNPLHYKQTIIGDIRT